MESKLNRHLELDLHVRKYISQLRDLAKCLYDADAKKGGQSEGGWCTRDCVQMMHVDDMTAVNEPSVPREAQQARARYIRNVNGQYDLVRDIMVSYLPELGAGSKDSSAVMDEIITNILEHNRGEKVLVLLFDCGPLNYSPVVAMALGQLLVDIGMYNVVQVSGCYCT